MESSFLFRALPSLGILRCSALAPVDWSGKGQVYTLSSLTWLGSCVTDLWISCCVEFEWGTLKHVVFLCGVPHASNEFGNLSLVLFFLGILIDSQARECRPPIRPLTTRQMEVVIACCMHTLWLRKLYLGGAPWLFAGSIVLRRQGLFCLRFSGATLGVLVLMHSVQLTLSMGALL